MKKTGKSISVLLILSMLVTSFVVPTAFAAKKTPPTISAYQEIGGDVFVKVDVKGNGAYLSDVNAVYINSNAQKLSTKDYSYTPEGNVIIKLSCFQSGTKNMIALESPEYNGAYCEIAPPPTITAKRDNKIVVLEVGNKKYVSGIAELWINSKQVNPVGFSTTSEGNVDIDWGKFAEYGEFNISLLSNGYFSANCKYSAPPSVPKAEPAGNSFTNEQNVKLTSVAGAKIYYTTDGTEPTDKSAEYKEPIKISVTSTLKAIAIFDNAKSTVLTENYTIAGTSPSPSATPTPDPGAQVGSMENFLIKNTYTRGLFTDVDETLWYGFDKQKVIANVYNYGLMKGSSDNTFNPKGNVTIAESIAMASRVHSIYFTGSENFIQGSPWYQVYIDYAIGKSIIGSGDFPNLNRAATRAEMAYIFSKALPEKEFLSLNTVNRIPDVNNSTPYREAIITLYKAGVLTGSDSVGTFYPAKNISRAESAAIISRIALNSFRISGKTYS